MFEKYNCPPHLIQGSQYHRNTLLCDSIKLLHQLTHTVIVALAVLLQRVIVLPGQFV